MNVLNEKSVSCPYCGETIDVLIDASINYQEYIEDCQVCCRPINFIVRVHNEDEIDVSLFHENE